MADHLVTQVATTTLFIYRPYSILMFPGTKVLKAKKKNDYKILRPGEPVISNDPRPIQYG